MTGRTASIRAGAMTTHIRAAILAFGLEAASQVMPVSR